MSSHVEDSVTFTPRQAKWPVKKKQQERYNTEYNTPIHNKQKS